MVCTVNQGEPSWSLLFVELRFFADVVCEIFGRVAMDGVLHDSGKKGYL